MITNGGAPGDRAIELRVGEIRQLFHTLDPFPFRERDLDVEVERYVVGWAGELETARPIDIVVHMPASEAVKPEAAHIGEAVRNFFTYRAEVEGWRLRELLRTGRSALLVGLVLLAACTAAGKALDRMFHGSDFIRLVEEGLLILGWVANWRPIEIFLYEWSPLVRRRRLLESLAKAQVRVHPDAADEGDAP
jgi:hypothetical protein